MLKEKRRLDFSSKNEEEYNLPFSVTELRQSLQRANDSTTGLEQVHYQLLTHLPNSALSVLLKVYNHMWESGCFPPSWREAVIIPIPKLGKDPSNFRPIALTSCLCKTMERMINARLMWSLESQGLLSEKQCSFRKNRSTLDHLICFETSIRNAFVKKETRLNHFLWPWESLQHNVEAQHSGGPLESRFQGPPPQVYSELPVRTFFQG